LEKNPIVASNEISRKPSTNLGNFCQRRLLCFVSRRLVLLTPNKSRNQALQSDERIAAGLGEDGDFTGGIGVERARGSGLSCVVNRKAGPNAVGVIGKVQRVTDQWEDEERDCAEGQYGCNSVRRIFFVGFDCAWLR